MPHEERLPALVAVVVGRGERIALVIAGRERWVGRDGYTFVPAELPGGVVQDADRPDQAARRICAAVLRGMVTIRPSLRLYGPSARHAIDVLPTDGEREPLPLLRLTRLLPIEVGAHMPHVATVRAYLAAAPHGVEPAPGVSGLLWLTTRALRTALRGAPLADLLAADGAELHVSSREALPPDAFVYVPAEYGERHLVRIAAKYGAEALFQQYGVEADDDVRS